MEKCAWTAVDRATVFDFCDGYISYLNAGKTERLCVTITEEMAKNAGFVPLDTVDNLTAGMKVYQVNRAKNIVLAVIGKEPITAGVNLVAAHIDSPRVDLKPNPLYEDSGMAMVKTHYYGGIKKYQWTAIPLSLIGVVVRADGSVVDINIGEEATDPVFTITDLLPHLAVEQMSKKMTEAFTGEDLNALIGSLPSDDDKDKYKDNILTLIREKYGFEEEDFISAELELVPTFPARSLGLDSSMIGAYGQDDRVCAYTALAGILELTNPTRTAVCFLADKEEIGSVGNTGMKSRFFENFLAHLASKCGGYTDLTLREILTNSMCLSADVTAGMDPNYKSVCEPLNSAYMGGGLAICKYTGARGKSSTSDANAEFVAKVRGIFNQNNITWQICELGKVDQGGGGTVAQYIANLDVDTLDVGVPLLSMHAPFEVASKVDVYMAYLGYKAFYLA
ncbi:MAG: aminopeptidase [Ruminococcaceae bacterium]|nr:aminopeptidase [Oscillospiraceae bacterium]